MGKKILLADDSITIQKVIELTFSDEDFEVVTVGNGRLALERVNEAPPDILLCDIIMPEKDGYEVCEFVKRNPSLAHIPVLLLTGAFEPFDQERAARVGCDGFLAKPFEPQTLIAKVKDLLQRAERPAAAPAPAPRPVVAMPPPTPAAPTPPAPPTPASFEPAPLEEMDEPFFSPEPQQQQPPPPARLAEPEVQFIPEDPFAEAAGFAPLRSADVPAPSQTYTPPPPEPDPILAFERDTAREAPAVEPQAPTPVEPLLPEEPEDLLPLTSEEAVTLGSPAAPTPVPPPAPEPLPAAWAGATVEVPLEERAQASVEAATAEPEPFFEEVFEEESASTGSVGAVVADPPTEPEVEALVEPIPEPEPEPEPLPPPPVVEPVVAAPPTASAPPTPPTPQPPPPPAVAHVAAAAPASEPAYDQTLVEEMSFADLAEAAAAQPAPSAPAAPSASAAMPVPMDMVSQIAQRVVAQISEKVIREIAWEVIPDLAEVLIKKEIERLKAELQET
jgi:CheY-like chemotaxis protein